MVKPVLITKYSMQLELFDMGSVNKHIGENGFQFFLLGLAILENRVENESFNFNKMKIHI